jgi:hypothetical protein
MTASCRVRAKLCATFGRLYFSCTRALAEVPNRFRLLGSHNSEITDSAKSFGVSARNLTPIHVLLVCAHKVVAKSVSPVAPMPLPIAQSRHLPQNPLEIEPT